MMAYIENAMNGIAIGIAGMAETIVAGLQTIGERIAAFLGVRPDPELDAGEATPLRTFNGLTDLITTGYDFRHAGRIDAIVADGEHIYVGGQFTTLDSGATNLDDGDHSMSFASRIVTSANGYFAPRDLEPSIRHIPGRATHHCPYCESTYINPPRLRCDDGCGAGLLPIAPAGLGLLAGINNRQMTIAWDEQQRIIGATLQSLIPSDAF